MRLTSTPESAHAGEPSLLAVAETILAVAVYLAICVARQSFVILAISSCTAALMLFRTDAASRWAIVSLQKLWGDDAPPVKLLNRISEKAGNRETSSLLRAMLALAWIASGVLLVVTTSIAGLALRVAGTSIEFARHPLTSVSVMGANWYRQALCTDSMHPPELVPLECVYAAEEYPTYREAMSLFTAFEKGWQRALIVILLTPLLVFAWIPSLFYRVTFKATCVVFAPLSLVAHYTLHPTRDLQTRMKRILDGAPEKLARAVGGFALSALAISQLVSLGILVPVRLADAIKLTPKGAQLLAIGIWPAWQILLTIAAALSWALYYFADMALGRMDTPNAWNADVVRTSLSLASFVRGVCALACVVLFYSVAYQIAFPSGVQSTLVTWARGFAARVF